MQKKHFWIINAHGEHEAAVLGIDDAFLLNGASLTWATFKQIDRISHTILNNLELHIHKKNRNPLVACSYTLPFNKKGDVWILVWRNDLRETQKILSNSESQSIYRYNSTTWKMERGIQDLLERKDIIANRDLETSGKNKDKIIEELKRTNKYWICKLIGGKDEFDGPELTLLNTLHKKEHLKFYENVLLKEFEEETVRRWLQKIAYFGKLIELKNDFTKVSRSSVSLIDEDYNGEPMSKQKISEWELSQDLCSVFMPLHVALLISQQAIATTLSHKWKDYRTKLSSNMRTFTLFKHIISNRNEVEEALGITIH